MKQKQGRDRELAVQRYLKGEGLSAIAQSLGYSRRWVYKWVARYNLGRINKSFNRSSNRRACHRQRAW